MKSKYTTKLKLFYVLEVEQVPSAHQRVYWTGGFRHELQAKWSWCTKDSPDPIDPSFYASLGLPSESYPGTGAETTPRGRTEKDDLNCAAVELSIEGGVSSSFCNATKVFLFCESVEKDLTDLLVSLNKKKMKSIVYNMTITAGYKMQG
jgi:hypothetical protein